MIDLNKTRLKVIYLFEVRPGISVESFSWTATGAGSYYTQFKPSEYGEIVLVEEDGVALTKVNSVADCDVTTSSFFFDYDNERLYVHTSGDDAPDSTDASGDYKYCLIAYFWVCFTNRQSLIRDGGRVVYTPQDASHNVYYLPYLNVGALPSVQQSVGEYWLGQVTIDYGRIGFLNDSWWYKTLNWLWNNAPAELKFGELGSSYSDFLTFFRGVVQNPEFSDEEVSFELRDERTSKFRQIPIYKFWTSNYPNLEEGTEGRVIPIPFGEVKNITPVCIDTVNHVYKISNYQIQSIDAVYRDGVLLTAGTDYTTDLVNAEFTLTFDPGDSTITCDVKGILCDYGLGTYSENVADILYWVLTELNDIPASKIDMISFDDLKAARAQKLSHYLNYSISTWEFLRLLVATGVFHLIFTPSGEYKVARYVAGSTGATELTQDYLMSLRVARRTHGVYRRVVVKYDPDPSTGEWKRVETSDAKAKYKFKAEETLTVETLLRDKEEAKSLASLYLQMVKTPGKLVELETNWKLIDASPTGKIILSKELKDVKILENEVYRILEAEKHLATSSVSIIAQEDYQISGESHADIAHEDTHSDSHSNSPHENVAHENVAHSNVAHSDVAHSDTAHGDSGHSNVAHENIAHENVAHEDVAHSDVAHSDVAHSDVAHSNVAHENVAHSNVAHSNSHSDVAHEDIVHSDVAHEDVAHSDVAHDDVAHSDYTDYTDHFDDPLHDDEISHFDVAHSNTPHENVAHSNVAHENVAHSDVAHENTHSDSPHEDVAHSDSPHEDVAHSNVAHGNVAHENVAHSNVAHEDVAHSDVAHEDSAHTNTSHENVAHENVAHSNIAHEDVAHSDVDHGDSYSDAHSNVPHTNSSY